MRWHELLAGLDVRERVRDADVEVTSITEDSRRVAPGACFAARVGGAVDGHAHAPDAVAAGAVALIVERALPLDVPQARVDSVLRALGPAASRLYGDPSHAVRCLGVTGTAGKTTTTMLLASIVSAAGQTAGLIGSDGVFAGDERLDVETSTPTMPQADQLQALLAEMRDRRVDTVAMEVTSRALDQHRVDGTWFAAACFTNLSHEHLDDHGSMDAYFAAKLELFDPARVGSVASNVDDPYGARVRTHSVAAGIDVWTYGARDAHADLGAVDVALSDRGARFTIVDRRADAREAVVLPLLGDFNVLNALAAAATARAAGFALDVVGAGLEAARTVPGRVEPIAVGQPFMVLVDYAHSPGEITAVLAAARDLAGRDGRVIITFGCGGNRDPSKRPLMGAAAGAGADLAILTSDNPRREDPQAIVDAVLPGLREGRAEVRVQLDRRLAIADAVAAARAGDVVVIAGKGAESGQTTGDIVLPFDDRVVARAELGALGVELTAREIAEITGTATVIGDAFARARSWSNDSRALGPGACFVALIDTRDGHDFVGDAFARGATVALVTRAVPERPPAGAAIVQVDDALAALAALGAAARERLGAAVVVGITGSSGKTGTKDLVAGALGRTFRVHASPGSFNNEIGLPVTLLGAPAATEALVLEMGARFEGNIADLCAIARPDVGVITNVGMSHAGLLGGPEGIARVKGELLEALTADGVAVLDVGDTATPGLIARTVARVLTVAVDPRAGVAPPPELVASRVMLDGELRPSFVLQSPWGSGTIHLAVRGAHQVVNASLAGAVALARGVPFDDVVAGLATVTPAPGRMDVRRTASGALLIDDAYNANPASMSAALRALEGVGAAGRTIAVVGDMLELGDVTASEHARVGEQAAAAGLDVLVAVGDAMTVAAGAARAASPAVDLVLEAPDAASALDVVRSLDVRADDVVLVKGSHAIGLERVVDGLARPRSVVS